MMTLLLLLSFIDAQHRFHLVPGFGNSIIRHFASNASEMKKLAARDFEDLLQGKYFLTVFSSHLQIHIP
jgi:hypothetical protein